MVINRRKTKHYYSELSMSSLCDCDYCRLYQSKSKAAYPQLAVSDKARIDELDLFIQRLYEDNVLGKINDERFNKISSIYEDEQKTLIQRIDQNESSLKTIKEKRLNIDFFIRLVQKYTTIEKLDAEVIREFIKKIYVHKAENVDGKRTQRIEIEFNSVGKIQ